MFELKADSGSLAASASVPRAAGASTSSCSIEVDAGSYRLEASALAGSDAAPITVATASAPITVVAGARTAAALTLRATYLPAVTGFAADWGLPGEGRFMR